MRQFDCRCQISGDNGVTVTRDRVCVIASLRRDLRNAEHWRAESRLAARWAQVLTVGPAPSPVEDLANRALAPNEAAYFLAPVDRGVLLERRALAERAAPIQAVS